MNTVTPVTITTPDGVERELRFTLGARKRINEIFGCGMKEALDKFDAGAFPGVLFALMYDREGKPPDVTIAWLEENLPSDASNEIMAAIMSSAVQGKTPKKDIEDLLRAANELQLRQMQGGTGLSSGPSAPRSSESMIETSGGDSSSAKSKPESNGTEIPSASSASSSEPLPPQPLTQ